MLFLDRLHNSRHKIFPGPDAIAATVVINWSHFEKSWFYYQDLFGNLTALSRDLIGSLSGPYREVFGTLSGLIHICSPTVVRWMADDDLTLLQPFHFPVLHVLKSGNFNPLQVSQYGKLDSFKNLQVYNNQLFICFSVCVIPTVIPAPLYFLFSCQ